MKTVTPDMVKELRACTGVGMSKCKEALVESGGDMQKAIDYLRKAGMASAVKKEGRDTKEGMIATFETEKVLALVEANAETDFVVKNDKFKTFLEDICEQAALTTPSSLEAFLDQKYSKDPSLTIDQYRHLVIQALGENIQVKKMNIIVKDKNASLGIYSHMGGKLVCIVEIEGSSEEVELAREFAMHVAAENPEYINPEDVPLSVKEREEDIARSQIKGKPENVIERIVAGKLQAFCNEFCLNCQKFIKDTSKTIAQVLEARAKEEKRSLKIRRFWRWRIGQ